MFSNILNSKLPQISKEQQDQEVQELLRLFLVLVNTQGQDAYWMLLRDLMRQRAYFLVRHAIHGLGLSVEEALQLLKDPSPDTEQKRKLKRSLQAAIDNLIDFAVAEEYQMGKELKKDNDEEHEHNLKVFNKYNKRYALVENLDVIYATTIAAEWSRYKDSTILVYTTQGDHRVRPWHAAWEGFSETAANFPAWLIPPIEPGCRCYLVEDTVRNAGGQMRADIAPLLPPDWINPVYSESVAKGGRIFSDQHSYFNIDTLDIDMVRDCATQLKNTLEEWLN